MKRTIPVLLLLICLSLLIGCAQAEDDVPFMYTIEDGEVTITGYIGEGGGDLVIPATIEGYPVRVIGESAFCDIWGVFNGKLVLPEGLREVRQDAFSQTTFTGALELPSTLKSIGASAFRYCYFDSNTTLVLPDGLEEIGDEAFGCNNFTGTVTIPRSVTKLGSRILVYSFGEAKIAFENPEMRKFNYIVYNGEAIIVGYTDNSGDLVIPAEIDGYTVSGIDYNAFNFERQFNNVYISEGIRNIERWAFNGFWCNGETFSLPSTLTTIGRGAFSYSRIDEMTIPASVNSVSANAFDGAVINNLIVLNPELARVVFTYDLEDGQAILTGCQNLVPISEIPSSVDGYPVVAIGSQAFRGKKFAGGLTIPEGIERIEDSAFEDAQGFDGELQLPGTLKSIGRYAFLQCGLKGELCIPQGVESIGEYAFGYTYFSSVSLPDTLKTIGDYAFAWCSRLSGTVTIPESVEQMNALAFSGSKVELIILNPDLDNPVFSYELEGDKAILTGYQGLSAITEIPATVDGYPVYAIGSSAFYGQRFSGGLTIPEGVVKIESYAFFGATDLDGELILPSTLNYIGRSAFANCYGLKGTVVIPEGVETIPQWSFQCTGISSIVFPSTLKRIEKSAFIHCEMKGEVVIPESAEYVDKDAFQYCEVDLVVLNEELDHRVFTYTIEDGKVTITGYEGLSPITEIPSMIEGYPVTVIGESALVTRRVARNLTIPEGIERIEDRAFLGASGFDGELVLPRSLQYIGKYAFSNCTSIYGNLVIPEGIEVIQEGTFVKTGITSVAFPATLREIQSRAFYYTALRGKVTIPASVETLAEDAFEGCDVEIVFGDPEADLSAFTFTLPTQTKRIEEEAFNNAEAVKVVVIPQGCEYIGSGAFRNCVNLQSISIPVSVSYIAPDAFASCDKLTILAPQGSYAWQYANERGISCVADGGAEIRS